MTTGDPELDRRFQAQRDSIVNSPDVLFLRSVEKKIKLQKGLDMSKDLNLSNLIPSDFNRQALIKNVQNNFRELGIKANAGAMYEKAYYEFQNLQGFKSTTNNQFNKIKSVVIRNVDFDALATADEILDAQPFYYDRSGLWFFWNNNTKAWQDIDEVDIMKTIDDILQGLDYGIKTTKSQIKSEILEALKRQSRRREPKQLTKTQIQFGNQIFDYETKKFISSTHEYFSVNYIPHNVGYIIETPTIDKLLKQWAGDRWENLKEYLCFACINGYPLQRLIFLVGSGSNGKGSYMRLLTRFVGSHNIVSTSLSKLEESRFETAKLHHKLVFVVSETNYTIMEKTETMKQLSGGDLIGAEHKGKPSFDFYNKAKGFILTNGLPDTLDKTDAFFRRPQIEDFSNKFLEGRPPEEDIPESEFEALASQALEIIPQLLTRYKFIHDCDLAERRERYEARSNPLGQFIKESYASNVGNDIPLWEIREDFKTFCKERGHREFTERQFSEALHNLGYAIKLLTRNGKTLRHVLNLIKNNANNANNASSTQSSLIEKSSEKSVISVISVIDKHNWILADKDKLGNCKHCNNAGKALMFCEVGQIEGSICDGCFNAYH